MVCRACGVPAPMGRSQSEYNRAVPALFPSQFSGRRQELMKKYEELSLQLKEAEKSKEIAEEDEALKRAVTAVESLMMGGASDAESERG